MVVALLCCGEECCDWAVAGRVLGLKGSWLAGLWPDGLEMARSWLDGYGEVYLRGYAHT